MDAKKQKPEPGQRVTRAAQSLRLLEHKDDAKRDHRHGIGRNIHLEPKPCHQPGACRRSNIRPEDDANTAD